MEKRNDLSFFLMLLGLVVPFLLAGCGKKGPPEPPEGSSYAYPGKYPPEE